MNSSQRVRRERQGGIGFAGFLIVLIVICAIFLTAVKIFPTFVEYRAIVSAVKKARASSNTEAEIRRAFDRSAAIEDITSITGKDLVITKANDNYLVSFAYTKKIGLIEPVSLVIDYAGDSKDL
jgi:hypothetical protein